MCGCGCELGLVLAACRSDAPRASRPRTLLERFVTAWLACLLGNPTPQDLSRGSGR
jgi:hypothetical protein